MRFQASWFLPFLSVLAGCASTIPSEWRSVPQAPFIGSISLGEDGKVTQVQPEKARSPIRLVGNAIANGEKKLTEEFKAVDSFDLSESRGEVVFSVKRKNDFDIGLVAVEGSDISWVPNDPADEVAVQWAPRGNKISYVVRSKFGDIVRTVHIPTAFNLSIDFPFSRVHELAWDPKGERYAVVYSSPITSQAADVLKYDGGQRVAAVPAASKIDFDIQPSTGDAILLQPFDIRYGEKLPLVIWCDDDRLAWNDARAELLRTARVALIVTSKADGALLQRVKESPVLDSGRLFAVNCEVEGALTLKADADMRPGYRREGNVVTVAAADVESFAARFIARELERTSPPNGSRR
jgi:hypothetical protein